MKKVAGPQFVNFDWGSLMMASKFAPFIARGRLSGTTPDPQTKFAPWIT